MAITANLLHHLWQYELPLYFKVLHVGGSDHTRPSPHVLYSHPIEPLFFLIIGCQKPTYKVKMMENGSLLKRLKFPYVIDRSLML